LIKPPPRQRGAEQAPLVPEPFLHVGDERIYNPLTDRTISRADHQGAAVGDLLTGAIRVDALADSLRRRLIEEAWLVEDTGDLSRRFLLKFVALEASTVCNQKCYFCPVSVQPREEYAMPIEQYQGIVGQLAAYRETIQAVFMINYNEPTADKRFVDQVRIIKEAGLPPAVNTNATGLTPERVDAILEMGGLCFLSVNLSTLDRQRYQDDRGYDHLDIVLRNLDYVKHRPLAPRMDLAVLGTGDEEHRRQFAAIRERFTGSRFSVLSFVVNDRAGYLGLPLPPERRRRSLRGCEQTGSRPLQYLHITPRAKVVLCCQDYSETTEVGDLNEQSIADVLAGPTLSRMRRWTYGLEEAPHDYICRNCKFALGE
jgi:MoaA/NifB/PqqE/SkfB family radical SAM enzyme